MLVRLPVVLKSVTRVAVMIRITSKIKAAIAESNRKLSLDIVLVQMLTCRTIVACNMVRQ